jgi:hypothetical protein
MNQLIYAHHLLYMVDVMLMRAAEGGRWQRPWPLPPRTLELFISFGQRVYKSIIIIRLDYCPLHLLLRTKQLFIIIVALLKWLQ